MMHASECAYQCEATQISCSGSYFCEVKRGKDLRQNGVYLDLMDVIMFCRKNQQARSEFIDCRQLQSLLFIHSEMFI